MWFIALLFACTSDTPVDTTSDPVCPDTSLPAGDVRVFADGFTKDGTAGTEGLVVSPDGRLFVGGVSYTGGGFVAEVRSDGSWDELTPLVGSVGLAWWRGRILAAVGGGGPAGEDGGVVFVDPDTGAIEVLAMGIPSANFVVVTPWETLLVSSPGGTTLWEVTDAGVVSEWLTDIESPNGLVFSEDGSTLFVAQTYNAPILMRSVDVNADGSAGTVTELATFADNGTLDGIALDTNGDVLALSNLPGELLRVTPSGEVTEVADAVDSGASLAYGRGDFDPCAVYVTSLFSDVVFEVGTGVPGASF